MIKKHILSVMTLTLMTGFSSPNIHAIGQDIDAKYSDYPAYNGSDLDVTVEEGKTYFAVWAPKADAVEINLYPSADSRESSQTIELQISDNGIWRRTVDKELYGWFYDIRTKYDGKWLMETPGIWAKATVNNGKRAAIVDLSKTNPEGWDNDKGPSLKNNTDAVIYEMHHRDFSISPTSGISHKGRFLALTELGTKNTFGQSTGIDHLKELGITHIHILPSYDYNSVDELHLEKNQYNWGYDPFNYNVPEGSYSTDPQTPEVRIKEMKQMIKTLHDNGIGVIMDVVYNHTSNNDDSNFSLTVPGYFYRHRQDGSYSDASGCGNETASERQMVQNYIVNSVKYWANEYHIDGFRFDLMAIHDIETMNRVARELKEINPDIIIYGEGWTAGDSPLPVSQRALKENVSKMNGIAVFSDDIRDAIKGHYSNAEDRGFATGKPGNEETVKIGIVASTSHPQVDYSKGNNSKFAYATSPEMIINYVSCHDDLMLTDKLAKSMKGSTEAQRQRAARLAQTIVFTSQGTPFMFAGEEIFRDKKGVHNSYKSPDSINEINWDLKNTNLDQFNYYRELIKLRKNHPAFRMTTAEDIAKHIVFDDIQIPNVISYSIIDNAAGDEWKEIKLIFNGSDEKVKMEIPKGNWIIIAQDGNLIADGIKTENGSQSITFGGETEIEPMSAYIIAQ